MTVEISYVRYTLRDSCAWSCHLDVAMLYWLPTVEYHPALRICGCAHEQGSRRHLYSSRHRRGTPLHQKRCRCWGTTNEQNSSPYWTRARMNRLVPDVCVAELHGRRFPPGRLASPFLDLLSERERRQSYSPRNHSPPATHGRCPC